MSRRAVWLGAAAVFVLAAMVRAVVALKFAFPAPEDSAYYAGVARNLVDGRGLVSDALWSYQTQPLVVPRAAFEIWLPLPTLLEAIPMAVLGTANWFRAAQVVPVVLGAVVAALAVQLGADVAAELRLPPGRARTMAVGTGVVASVLGPLAVFGALPDSTIAFAALSLAACLLMTRISAAPPTSPLRDRRLLGLGLLIGLAGLTRNDAVWLGLAWLLVAWLWTAATRRERAALVAVPAALAMLVFLPWAVRDWLVFGSPLPGQAVSNALSVTPFDIFAYQNQPTLARYLAQGPGELLGMRVDGFLHNVLAVLVIPAVPTGPLGLLALPRAGRLRALRPLVVTAAVTFLAATLLFPVSTTWGTFLHSAGAIHVLLIASSLVWLDSAIAWVGRHRGWTRPVAWIGPALAATVAVPLLMVSVTSLEQTSSDVEARYRALPVALARAGVTLDDSAPVIVDYPIWLAESAGVPTLALPEESPAAVLELAHRFGARLIVVETDERRSWPGIATGSSAVAACYEEIPLADTYRGDAAMTAALLHTHVLKVVCR